MGLRLGLTLGLKSPKLKWAYNIVQFNIVFYQPCLSLLHGGLSQSSLSKSLVQAAKKVNTFLNNATTSKK